VQSAVFSLGRDQGLTITRVVRYLGCVVTVTDADDAWNVKQLWELIKVGSFNVRLSELHIDSAHVCIQHSNSSSV